MYALIAMALALSLLVVLLRLGVKLGRKAGVAVVPVALKTDFQGNGRIIKDMGPVDPSKEIYIKFGEPISVEGSGQVAHQKIVGFITENLTAWGAKVNPI